MTVFAELYRLEIEVDLDDLSEIGLSMLESLAPPAWPAITSWASPLELAGGQVRADPIVDALHEDEVEDAIEWSYGEDVTFTVGKAGDRMLVSANVLDTADGRGARWLSALHDAMARASEGHLPIVRGIVSRVGGGVACLPRLRVVGSASHLVLAAPALIAGSFEDAEAVARCGWDRRVVGGRWLLSRALGATTNVDMLAAIQDGQWAMARLARPGAASYAGVGAVRPEEEPIHRAGEPTVLAVGYLPDEKEAAFSCAIGEDEHIRGWEILALRDLVAGGRTPGGDPVERVTVLFPDRAGAARERRPLLDVGVRVLYHDAGGERAELTA